jgi:chemotaxis protein methyltransferase CheR
MPPPVWETGSEQVAYLGELAHRIGGFELEKERSLLSDPRVMDLLFREKAGTVEELVARLRKLPEGPLHHNVVESLAVSDTSFFRDCHVFDLVEKSLLPCLIENREREQRLSMWSAGCSTGQEAYSLAIAAQLALEDFAGWNWKILGTDLSTRNIRAAESGVYSQFDINCGLPARRLVDFFEKREGSWCVRESVKKHVVFHKMNLASTDSAYPPMDRFNPDFAIGESTERKKPVAFSTKNAKA